MAVRTGSNLKLPSGHSFFFDCTIPESYSGSGATWTNLSNTSSNCTLTGTPTFSRSFLGVGSLAFNGSSMYGTCPELGLGNNFTLIAWIKKSEGSTSGYIIGAGWETSNQALNFGVRGLTPSLNNTAFSSGRTEVTGSNITADTWTHLCAVKSSGVGYMYVNGIQTGTGTFNPSYYNTGGAADSFIGRSGFESPNYFGDPGNYQYFAGSIGMIVIYNSTVLTSAQILDNFNQTKGRFGR